MGIQEHPENSVKNQEISEYVRSQPEETSIIDEPAPILHLLPMVERRGRVHQRQDEHEAEIPEKSRKITKRK